MNKILLTALLALSAPTWAGTTSSNLTNSSQVLSSCSLSVGEHINFGVVNALTDTTKTGSGSVRASCTKGSYALTVSYGANSKYWVWSNAGQGTTYRCRARAMANGKGSTLQYDLYTDSGFTQPVSTSDQIMISGGTYVNTPCTLNSAWTSVVFSSPGTQTVPLYGKMTVNNTVNAGVYTDSLVITITF